jgi:hypothetical protein
MKLTEEVATPSDIISTISELRWNSQSVPSVQFLEYYELECAENWPSLVRKFCNIIRKSAGIRIDFRKRTFHENLTECRFNIRVSCIYVLIIKSLFVVQMLVCDW